MNSGSYNSGVMDKKLTTLEELGEIEKLFSITGDQTRLKIMFALLDDQKCHHTDQKYHCGQCSPLTCMVYKSVGEIVEITGASQSLVSHQLKVLRDAKLVNTKKEGLKVYYCLKDGHVQQLLKVALEHIKEKEEND